MEDMNLFENITIET
jgi:hypothetical protein